MSSTYSAESAASPSDLNELECEPLRSARSIPSASECLRNTGLPFLATPTSEELPQNGSQRTPQPETSESMSSAVAFLAKISQRPESSEALKPNAVGFGPNMRASFAKFDRDMSSWKTSQTSLFGGLSEFLGTWPRSGLMRGGDVCELAILEPRTSEIGFGLLPTPRAAKRGARRPETAIASLQRRGRTKAHKLEDALVILEGRTGIPSPEYVEWMMGLKPTWTELAPAATPSFRKSQKSSGEQS